MEHFLNHNSFRYIHILYRFALSVNTYVEFLLPSHIYYVI